VIQRLVMGLHRAAVKEEGSYFPCDPAVRCEVQRNAGVFVLCATPQAAIVAPLYQHLPLPLSRTPPDLASTSSSPRALTPASASPSPQQQQQQP
jgi:hypothetical protein